MNTFGTILMMIQSIANASFGVVFKATTATSDITVAYKLIARSDEDEFFKDFVKEVGNHT